MSIVIAKPKHSEGILSIYKPVVENSAASFATSTPTIDEMKHKIRQTTEIYPWIVYEVDSQVAGYAYATIHRSREAYQWSVEPSVYVHPDQRDKGIGKKLYAALFRILRHQNFTKAIAIITIPNEASIALHKSLGFSHIGIFKNAGFKLGDWHDTSWWELQIKKDKSAIPQSIIPFEMIDQNKLRSILAN